MTRDDTIYLVAEKAGRIVGLCGVQNISGEGEITSNAPLSSVKLTELPLEQRTVNVKNLNETTAFQLKVQKPSEDAIISNDTVTVTVMIEPVTEE